MPTYGDETLHDRYAREHVDHLARLAKLTPEQIAEMELSLHNALAEIDQLRAQLPSQGGEAVEVVATVEAYGGKWAGIHWGDRIGSTEDPERQLMTVAQHQRILAAATHPADQVAEGSAQHARDSAELRCLCAARDQYRDLSIKHGDKLSEVFKLLARCQEKLDPHRDAVLWGEVCDVFKGKS